ncbi:hypothetical protein [Hymenobacter fastidiosus]|uniref:hypothetical protein n=1 Tax=Hymenobacter fastidiosus TaxID=486264 RepID=UPI0031E7331D
MLVVSEETGPMSLVRGGDVFRNLSSSDRRARLDEFLFDVQPNSDHCGSRDQGGSSGVGPCPFPIHNFGSSATRALAVLS